MSNETKRVYNALKKKMKPTCTSSGPVRFCCIETFF